MQYGAVYVTVNTGFVMLNKNWNKLLLLTKLNVMSKTTLFCQEGKQWPHILLVANTFE